MTPSDPRARPLLLLWGFMGTGKSTVGRQVAELAAAELVDLDARIVEHSGRSIERMFAESGEAAFRAVERELLGDLLGELLGEDAAPRIVALGGGALLDDEMLERALATGWVVTLHANLDTLVERTRGDGRPLLGKGNRKRTLADLYKRREPAYRRAHDVVDTDGRTAAEIAAWLNDRWHPEQ